MQFVDVKNDIAFRKIFGNSNKPEILISFLNAILELPKGKKIIHIKFEDTFLPPFVKKLKSSMLDLRVTDERNISYIIEMQVEETDGFDKRVQYYTAKKYASQINVGEDYPRLNQVIFIGILDFIFFKNCNECITRHRTVNIKTGENSLNALLYNFVELPKFTKNLDEITSLTDKWIYFLKNADNLDIIPPGIKDKGLRYAYEDAAKHAWTMAELDSYDYASMRKQDQRGIVTLAVKRGIEKEKERNKKIIEQIEAKKQKAEAEKQEAELTASIFKYYFVEKKEINEIAKITGKNKEYLKDILSL